MKKTALVLLLLLSLLLTGCNDYAPFVRLEKRIMAQLVGIDYHNGIYTITIQFPLGTGVDTGGSSNDLKVVSGSGANLFYAAELARASLGKKIFYSHNQVLFLGSELIEKGNPTEAIEQYLIYCEDYPKPHIAGVHGTAEGLLALTYKDEYSAENKLKLILENAAGTGVVPTLAVYEALMSAYNTSASFVIPMIREEEKSENQQSESVKEAQEADKDETKSGEEPSDPKLTISDTAVIIGGAFSHYTDTIESRGLSYFKNMAGVVSVNFFMPHDDKPLDSGAFDDAGHHHHEHNPERNDNSSEYQYNYGFGQSKHNAEVQISSLHDTHGDIYSIQMFRAKVKVKPLVSGDNITFRISFRAVVDKSHNRVLGGAYGLNRACNVELKNRTESAVEDTLARAVTGVTSKGGDVFMLEEALKHHHLKKWKEVEEDWREVLKSVQFVYDVKVKFI